MVSVKILSIRPCRTEQNMSLCFSSSWSLSMRQPVVLKSHWPLKCGRRKQGRLGDAPESVRKVCTTRVLGTTMQAHGNDPRDMTERLVTYCCNRGIERDIASRAIGTAQRAMRDWTAVTSDFFTPPESVSIQAAIESLPDIRVLTWGGYDDAERRALFVAHSEAIPTNEILKDFANDQLAVLKIIGNFEHSKASHRDFMGAVLNAGISRQKIGDIVVMETEGAQVIVHKEVAQFLQTSVVSVRDVKVTVDVVGIAELQTVAKRIKEVQSIESSTRLDAVVSAGLKISRTKMADMARSGLVHVNYKEMKSPAKTVKSGDVVSVRGVGKLEIGDITTTAKGRYRIEMKKFL